MFCSCTPAIYKVPQQAFSPHISRGYIAHQVNSRLTRVRLQRPKPFPGKAGRKEDRESLLSHVLAPSALAAVQGKGATPFGPQTVVLTKQAYRERTWQANYGRAQYAPVAERETALKAAGEAHHATLRDLPQRLDGTPSEQATRLNQAGAPTSARPRQRGHQPGRPGHGRRAGATLPVVDAVRALSPAEPSCPSWGTACRPWPGPEASTILDVPSQAHVRRLHRPRSHQGWRCRHPPGGVTAPPARRLLAHRTVGGAVGTAVVLDQSLDGPATTR